MEQELRSVLGETQRAASQIQTELRDAHKEIATLAQALSRDDAELARLRGELRSRWKNLKRAFAPQRVTS